MSRQGQPYDPEFPAGKPPAGQTPLDPVQTDAQKARILWVKASQVPIPAAPLVAELPLMSLPASTAIDVFIQYQTATGQTITSPDGREEFRLYANEQRTSRVLTTFTPGGHVAGVGGNSLPPVGRIFAVRDYPADGWDVRISTANEVNDPDAAPTLYMWVTCIGWAREPTGIGPLELQTMLAGIEKTDGLLTFIAFGGLDDVSVPANTKSALFNYANPIDPDDDDTDLAGALNVVMMGVSSSNGLITPLAVTNAGKISIDVTGSGLATSANQTNGAQQTQVVDGAGHVQPAGDSLLRSQYVIPSDGGGNVQAACASVATAGFHRTTDGTNTMAVKAASTAPAATDPAAVVSISPNGNTVTPATVAAAPAVQNLALSTTSATQFASAACTRGVWVEALSTNTVSVYVGPSGVTTGTGLELQPGDREFFPVDNANRLYAITGTTTQNLRLLAL